MTAPPAPGERRRALGGDARLGARGGRSRGARGLRMDPAFAARRAVAGGARFRRAVVPARAPAGRGGARSDDPDPRRRWPTIRPPPTCRPPSTRCCAAGAASARTSPTSRSPAMRALGLPARYVSGYLVTAPAPGKPRLVGADASHAWLSVRSPDVRLARSRSDQRRRPDRSPRRRRLRARLRRRDPDARRPARRRPPPAPRLGGRRAGGLELLSESTERLPCPDA